MVLPLESVVTYTPASELWSVVLLETVEAVVALSLIPVAVDPLTGTPALVTRLPSMAMFVEEDTVIPTPVVVVTVKPWMITQLLVEIENPLLPPLTVTVAPGAVVKVIGAL